MLVLPVGSQAPSASVAVRARKWYREVIGVSKWGLSQSSKESPPEQRDLHPRPPHPRPGPGGPRAGGEFVLYWMQGIAMRVEGNFALNFAAQEADRLGL